MVWVVWLRRAVGRRGRFEICESDHHFRMDSNRIQSNLEASQVPTANMVIVVNETVCCIVVHCAVTTKSVCDYVASWTTLPPGEWHWNWLWIHSSTDSISTLTPTVIVTALTKTFSIRCSGVVRLPLVHFSPSCLVENLNTKFGAGNPHYGGICRTKIEILNTRTSSVGNLQLSVWNCNCLPLPWLC